jgi:hypothetical protein
MVHILVLLFVCFYHNHDFTVVVLVIVMVVVPVVSVMPVMMVAMMMGMILMMSSLAIVARLLGVWIQSRVIGSIWLAELGLICRLPIVWVIRVIIWIH